MNVNVKEKLYKQIKDYCSINNLPIGEYINDLLQKAFMVDKYGEKPSVLNTPKKKEKEPIVTFEEQNETTLITIEENTKIEESNVAKEELKHDAILVQDIEEEKTEKIKPPKRKLK